MAQKKPAQKKSAAPKKPSPAARKPAANKPAKAKPAARRSAAARPAKTVPPAAPVETRDELEELTPAVGDVLPEAPVPEDSAPEVAFASRVPPPMPERPRPLQRRAIFFDVENTSRPNDVARLLEHVAIDRVNVFTDLIASGNWRVIGNETARLLAKAGAQLVHSAPAVGVRDWSDLRIAVAAGVWLASARPGDQLDIVSDDKAFDAVGDVAATLGVFFRKLSYRALLRGGASAPEAREPRERAPRAERSPRAGGPRDGAEPRAGRGRRGGRGRTPRTDAALPSEPPVQGELIPTAPASSAREVLSDRELFAQRQRSAEAAVATVSPPASVPSANAKAAPEAQLLGVVDELLQRSPNGVMLDTLANKLKALGYERPPGSPRLVTRVRSFKELDVSPRGLIRYRKAGATPEAPDEQAPTEGADESEAKPAGADGRRRRRRGGRRGGGGSGSGPATPPASTEG